MPYSRPLGARFASLATDAPRTTVPSRRMRDSVSRFEALLRELRAHPAIAVTYARVFAPDAAALARFERSAQRRLTGALRELYTRCDGLQLAWIHKRSPEYDPRAHAFREGEDLRVVPGLGGAARATYRAAFDERPPFDGVIAINSLAELLPDADEVNTYEYEDRTYALGRFDEFSVSGDMALFFAAPDGEPLLVRGRDHSADYGGSCVCDLRTYLEFVLYTKGMVKERDFFDEEARPYRFRPLDEDSEYFSRRAPVDLDDFFQVYDRGFIGCHRFPFEAKRALLDDAGFEALRTRRVRCEAHLRFFGQNSTPKPGLERTVEAMFDALRAGGAAVCDAIVCASPPWADCEFEFVSEGDPSIDPAALHNALRDALRACIETVEARYGYLPSVRVRCVDA